MPDLNTLAEHYRDTCELVRSRERRRERLFLFISLSLALLLIQLQDEEVFIKLAEDITKGFLSPENLAANFAIIKGALWIILAALVQAYYQTDVAIERAYPYIHALEEKLNGDFGDNVFTREGKSYGKNYPWFLWWTWFFYKWIIPVGIIAVPGIDLISHLLTHSFTELWVLFRCVVFVIISTSTILYLRLVHYKK